MSVNTANLRSFHVSMGVNECFDLTDPWTGRTLVIFNPNAQPMMIWCGPIPIQQAPTMFSTGHWASDTPTVNGDLEIGPLTPEQLVEAVQFVREHGIPLPPNGIWEPLVVPSSDVHIAYADALEAYDVKGMV